MLDPLSLQLLLPPPTVRGHGSKGKVHEVERRQNDPKGEARPAQIVADAAGAAPLGLVAHDPHAELHAPAAGEHRGAADGVYGVQQRPAEEQRVGGGVDGGDGRRQGAPREVVSGTAVGVMRAGQECPEKGRTDNISWERQANLKIGFRMTRSSNKGSRVQSDAKSRVWMYAWWGCATGALEGVKGSLPSTNEDSA